ncbi:Kinesin-like protein [Phytophthora rubi]|uniref:Kinesin-like protein n=1 Tax=Phytophthora rubi TaxID=129364 RepID=A0A6A3N3G6_9STRA|nr:Kinesin-like protein [Phytophthora rubi]KAE9040718.1 Kinesin-like protein [Phytophthora rubi]KAE9346863.1 Kinesin-like protein [Phytophthora rubi]
MEEDAREPIEALTPPLDVSVVALDIEAQFEQQHDGTSAGDEELTDDNESVDGTSVSSRLVISTSSRLPGSKLRTPSKISRIPTPGRRSATSAASPTTGGRLGMAARTTPRALEKKVQRVGMSSDFGPRSADDSTPKRQSALEARRAYSASIKARMHGASPSAAADGSSSGGLRRTNSNSSMSSIASSVNSVSSVPKMRSKTPSSAAERRKTLHDLVESNKENRRSSLGSQSSCSSISSAATSASFVSASSRMGSSSRLGARSARSSSAAASSVRHKATSAAAKVWPASAPSMSMLPEDFTLNEESVMALKEDHDMAEKGVQELLEYVSTNSTSSVATAANMKTRLEEVKLLKAGLRRLSSHSEGLMRCCEAFERRTLEQNEYVDASSAEIERLTQLLNSEPSKQTDDSKGLLPELDLEDFHSDGPLSRSPHPTSDSETASTTSSQNIFPRLSSEEADRQRQEIQQAMQEDSPLSAFVRNILKKATDKIEEKWKTRFAEQLAEHEQALAQERERTSASVLSSSRLVTETLHGKDDELKAIQELNLNLNMQKRQLELDLDAARSELEFLKQQLDDDDDERSANAHSFWEKTTDLAKQNRNLTEELTQANKNVTRLNETIQMMKTKASSLKTEHGDRVRESKSMVAEKNLLQDKLAAMEANFEDEKHRREQFQVNVEQLTVENTALYAQMVALQTTHEAKMEEMQARYEKRNISLVGEMKLLQDQNRLMRRTEPSNQREAYGSSGAIGGSGYGSSNSMGSPTRADVEETTQRIQELTDDLLEARQEITEQADIIAELEMKIAEGETMRRKLHNTIQELRGNIRVHVRLRPFLRSDGEEALGENPQPAIMCDTFASTITTNVDNPHTFAFDKIYGQSDSQEFVFKDVSDFIQSAMDGYNVCIFAYGQTGSGKTHTMQGSGKAQMRGIIPRSIDLIINCCQELTMMGWNFSLMVTFYEIYNETIRDLLTMDSSMGIKHNIRTDNRGRNYVEGLTEVYIDFDQAAEQVDEIVNLAACNRSVDRTDMNAHSSRSHSIFALKIQGFNEAQNTEVEGSLSLVDLAGSERLSRSNATGNRLKEAQAINKSLSALADVFQALAKKSPHVPYRNSKLTYALQPALSGDGKTLMMANMSPTYASLDESLCSMRFAQKVSQCELGAPVRQIKSARRQSLGPGDFSRTSIKNSPPRESRRSTFTPGQLRKLL